MLAVVVVVLAGGGGGVFFAFFFLKFASALLNDIARGKAGQGRGGDTRGRPSSSRAPHQSPA